MITTFPNSRSIGNTLKDWLPREALGYDDVERRLARHYNVKVVGEFSWTNQPLNYPRWPGTHKNVGVWVILENGIAVGWNENAGVGWSFPSMKLVKRPMYRLQITTETGVVWAGLTPGNVVAEIEQAGLFTWAEAMKADKLTPGEPVQSLHVFQFAVSIKKSDILRPLCILRTNVKPES